MSNSRKTISLEGNAFLELPICFSSPRILPADIAASGKAIFDRDDDTWPHADPHRWPPSSSWMYDHHFDD